MNPYFEIGKIVAVHGLKGEVIVLHHLGKKTTLQGLKTLFTPEKNKGFFPWFVESGKAKSATELYLKLEGVDSPEEAKKLLKQTVWFTEEDFKKFSAKETTLGLLGFTIIDNKKILGEITEVIEQAHHLLCKIVVNNKEVLIPLPEDFLKKIDTRKKEVHVQLPDGLLDIYLTE